MLNGRLSPYCFIGNLKFIVGINILKIHNISSCIGYPLIFISIFMNKNVRCYILTIIPIELIIIPTIIIGISDIAIIIS